MEEGKIRHIVHSAGIRVKSEPGARDECPCSFYVEKNNAWQIGNIVINCIRNSEQWNSVTRVGGAYTIICGILSLLSKIDTIF